MREAPPDRIAAGQLLLHARQSMRVPVAGVLVSGFVLHLFWPYEPHSLLVGWAFALCSVLGARAFTGWFIVRNPPMPEKVAGLSRVMTGFNFVGGIIGGASALLFLPDVPSAEQAMLTTVLCCWCAGSISTSSSLPPAFLAFLVPFSVQMVAAWLLVDSPGASYMAGLIAMFAVYTFLFGRDNGRQVLHALQMQHENQGLIAELRREREEANAAREEAEAASRSKSRFIAAASHDLRQPLHALSLYSAALSQITRDTRTSRIARNMENAVDSLDNLFEALLDLSRLDAGVIVPVERSVSVARMFERFVEEYRPQARAKGLTLVSEPLAVSIQTDPALLERVLRNLLDNAVHYTGSGGITLRAHSTASGLSLCVIDTGIGVPAAEHTRIFEEFYQLANQARDPARGLGLGLASVQRMADLLGFRISLQSAPGEGSMFSIEIPSDRVMHAEESDAPPMSRMSLAGRTVLVLEDDLRAQDALVTLVAQWGCIPIKAVDAGEALQQITLTGQPPDLVLADYRLGSGCNGVQAVKALTDRVGRLPAILLTGEIDSERLREARDSGLPLLHKPVKEMQLRAAVEAVLLPSS